MGRLGVIFLLEFDEGKPFFVWCGIPVGMYSLYSLLC